MKAADEQRLIKAVEAIGTGQGTALKEVSAEIKRSLENLSKTISSLAAQKTTSTVTTASSGNGITINAVPNSTVVITIDDGYAEYYEAYCLWLQSIGRCR